MAVIEAIATTYLEADAASVEFTSIPATYEHLTLHYTARSAGSGGGHVIMYLQFGTGGGAVDTGTNYSIHYIRGYASAAGTSVKTADGTYISAGRIPQEGEPSTEYGITKVDILDYANTNKNTTLQFLTTGHINGEIGYGGGGWFGGTQGAVDRIKLSMAANWVRGSQFSLYGIKSA